MALVKQEPACNDIAIIKQEHANLYHEPSSNQDSFDAVVIQDEEHKEENELASKPLGPEDFCDLNPEFAVICSFIIQFGDKIDVELDIEKLKSAIENQSSLDEDLIYIHVKLLKKLRRYFVRDQWEKALIRFASEYSYEHAYEIELFGYHKTRPSVKLELLRRLLDVQFQCDQKFKAAVNLCEANELRIPPLGRDVKGNTYWKKDDKGGNFKIYREEPLDHKSWKNICSTITELQDLIDELDKTQDERVKGEPMPDPYNPLPEIFPEYFMVKEAAPEQQSIEDKTVSSSKKSRHKGRRKNALKSLPILEEENSIVGNDSNSTEVGPVKDSKPVEIKPQIKCEKYSQENTAAVQENAISSLTESQVKTTLENIINKVVASFEYIMRPLSRNSNDSQINEEISQKRPQKKSTSRLKREKVREEVVPRRSSSRIQQLQLKKQADEEEEMKKMIEREQARAQREIISQDEDSRSRTSNRNGLKKSERTSNGKKRKKADWRKSRGKKKLSWDKDDSDLSSVSSATESDNDDDFDGTHDFSIDTNNLDDEFACEEEDANIEPVIIRRARTARQSMATSETGDFNETTMVEEDKPCGRCDKSNDPEWILLCDMCDGGYHASCTLPPLMVIPDGDWYCPSCEHKMLLTKLNDFHLSISHILAAKEVERKKKQLASKKKLNVEAKPVEVVQETTNGRRAKDILSELNEPIALQRLDECLGTDSESTSTIRSRQRPKKGHVTRKQKNQGSRNSYKKSRKTHPREHYSDSEELDAESSDEIAQLTSEDEIPKTRRARASVSYKFKEYDALIKSAIRGESGEDEVEATSEDNDEPAPHNYGRGKDMATIEALAYQQENGLTQDPVPPSKPSKARRKGRRLNDLDALSEAEDVTSDESFQASATEAEDAELTEEALSEETETSIDEIVGSLKKKKKKRTKHNVRRSSYESDDSDYQPNRSRRRAATKAFNYAESSAEEDEGSDIGERIKKAKKTILSSDEETEASWKSDPTKSDEDADEDLATPFDDDVTDEGEEPAHEEAEEKEVASEAHSSPIIENSSLDESIDEIAAPLYRSKQIVTTTMDSDPMDQLNQYCIEQASESTMYNSFTHILSKQSPPHPPFYGDDDPKQGANDKQKKSVEQTIPSH